MVDLINRYGSPTRESLLGRCDHIYDLRFVHGPVQQSLALIVHQHQVKQHCEVYIF